MALDYSQRKQINRNRPKKRSTKPFLLLILGAISGVYALGIGTGWLLFKGAAQNRAPVSSDPAKADESRKASGASPSAKDAASLPSPTGKGKETPLTFYYTLPKGDKGVIGSGVNLPRDESSPIAKREVPAPQASAVKPQQPVKSEQRDGRAKAPVEEKESMAKEAKPHEANDKPTSTLPMKQKKELGKGGYSVQVGSYHDRNEAQYLKSSLEKDGFSARVVEFAVPGKGVLYRVRVGNRMEQETATRLAVKVGKNAIAVPE
jgi:cell division septation protein DedD